jgi:oligopeptide/dipeptide ABC transporter ATP-binding protein
VQSLFDAPQHPYTQGLMAATPSPLRARGSRLADIPGMVADLSALPAGCAFAARCPRAFDRCRVERPPLVQVGAGRQAACFAVDAVDGLDGAHVADEPEGASHEFAVGA